MFTFQLKMESVEKPINGKPNSSPETVTALEKIDVKSLESKEPLKLQTNIPSNLAD